MECHEAFCFHANFLQWPEQFPKIPSNQNFIAQTMSLTQAYCNINLFAYDCVCLRGIFKGGNL